MDANQPSEASTLISNTIALEVDDNDILKEVKDENSVEASLLPSTPTLVESVIQKRILPTRSRRGGPGVGSSEIDQSILEAQRRAGQYYLVNYFYSFSSYQPS
jgi:hypothetical protein